MMDPHRPHRTNKGSRFQSGIPTRMPDGRPDSARGLKVRGVVVATYVVDDGNHPYANQPEGAKAVYCDVLSYSSIPGFRYHLIRKCLVKQDRGGAHSGRIWKPKAATLDFTEDQLDPKYSNPANLDGDHVLIGFIDDSFALPVIEGAIGHPNADWGNEEKTKGHRLQLKLEDGDPDFWKHHGSFYGIDDNGDYIVDTTQANDGQLEDDGKEADPPTDGKGAQRFDLPLDAEDFVIRFMDTSADPPEHKVTLKFNKTRFEMEWVDSTVFFTTDETKMELKLGGETLLAQDKDGNATLKLGDGAVHVAIVEHLETLWNDLMTALDTWAGSGGHTHPTGVGPSGPPTTPLVPSTEFPWNPDINSETLSLPDK